MLSMFLSKITFPVRKYRSACPLDLLAELKVFFFTSVITLQHNCGSIFIASLISYIVDMVIVRLYLERLWYLIGPWSCLFEY